MDKTNLKFHIKHDDYFGTLATILDLAQQTMKKDKNARGALREHLTLLKRMKDDLVFLQEHYRIVRK